MGLDIVGRPLIWDFIQDDTPADPGVTGITWLREDTGDVFYWDDAKNLWITIGGPIILQHSQEIVEAEITASTTYPAVWADQKMNTLGKAWRPRNRMILLRVTINSNTLPTANEKFEVKRNSNIVYTLNWDGSNKDESDDAVNVQFALDRRIDFQVTTGASPPMSLDWIAATYWKFGEVAP